MKYFIDWENVGPHGLTGASELHKDDMVVIFFSDHSPKLPIAALKELAATSAKIKWRFIEQTGSNALDFVIATEVGYVMAKNKKEDITIISKDNGYYSIVLYWQKRGRQIELRETVAKEKPADKQPLEVKQVVVQKKIKVTASDGKIKEPEHPAKKPVRNNNNKKKYYHHYKQHHMKKRANYHKQG